MTKTTVHRDDTVIIRVLGGAEIKWRTRRMLGLGADAELAARIADSGADVHDIERLLKAGCTLELAWAIVQPVEQPPSVASAAAQD